MTAVVFLPALVHDIDLPPRKIFTSEGIRDSGFGIRVSGFMFWVEGLSFSDIWSSTSTSHPDETPHKHSTFNMNCGGCGFGFRGSRSELQVSRFWCRLSSYRVIGFRVSGFGFIFFGFRVHIFGFRVQVFGFLDYEAVPGRKSAGGRMQGYVLLICFPGSGVRILGLRFRFQDFGLRVAVLGFRSLFCF